MGNSSIKLPKGDRKVDGWSTAVNVFVMASIDLAEVEATGCAADEELHLFQSALTKARESMMTTPAPDQAALDLKFRIFARDDCGALPPEQALPIMSAILWDIDNLPK